MIRRDFIKGALAGGLVGSGGAPRATAWAAGNTVATKQKPRIMFYNDGRHPLAYMYEPPMYKEEYESAVDELAGTTVQALMFTMGDGRTVLHDTKVGELWGHNVEKWPHLIFHRAHLNAKGLIEQGHDPLRIVCERAHLKGMQLYPVMLVQQGTGKRGEDVRASEFRFRNRHLEIGAQGRLPSEFECADCLDFKHEEVRNERFALAQETVTRYPVDGFELHLGYGKAYFRPEEVSAGRAVLTNWVEQVYRAVKASGEDRELAIRMPADLEICYARGLDVSEWIRRGIVDVLIGESQLGGKLLDQETDFRPLIQQAKGSRSRVHAVLHNVIDSDRLGRGIAPVVRATACNYWEQGVDGLYLNQWFDNWPYEAPFYEMLRELPHPDVMAPRDKFYFSPSTSLRYRRERLPAGMQLPAELKLAEPVRIKMTVSDDLPRWRQMGRVHEVLLRLRLANTTGRDLVDFRLNGRSLPESSLRKINSIYRVTAPRYRINSSYWYIFRLSESHWPVKGVNTVEAVLRQRDPEVIPRLYLRDVEIETKYLLGRNFHRGEDDPDLGPVTFGEIS